MTAFLTSDIHMSESPMDSYRWGLFDWIDEHDFDELIICGDLTNNKDHHSAKLVNRLHSCISKIAKERRVAIVKGNHDYYDENHPFFQFLDEIRNVSFITQVEDKIISIGGSLFVPSGEDWDTLNLMRVIRTDYIFAHVTWNGSQAENGSLLPGVDPAILKSFKGKCWSGDIHVPQKISKNIEYIGAPYHTRFGDSFVPRCVVLNNDGSTKDVHYLAPSKLTFDIRKPEELEKLKGKAGDHIKVRVHLLRGEYASTWRQYRNDIQAISKQHDWLLHGGIEPVLMDGKKKAETVDETKFTSTDDILTDYAKRHRATEEHLRIGKLLLT